MIGQQTGLPGVGNTVWAAPRVALYERIPGLSEFPLPIVIDGTKVYNQQNLPYYWLAYAGTIIGKVTATGLYAPSIIGQTTAAYTSGGGTLTVGTGTAAALNARIGASGTFQLQGPPTAAGTNATNASVTYSSINLTAGTVAISSAGANFVSGSLIQPNDGSQTPLLVVCDITGVKTTDWTNTNIINNYVVNAAVGGILNSNLVPNYPADTSIRTAIQNSLKFMVFSDVYVT